MYIFGSSFKCRFHSDFGQHMESNLTGTCCRIMIFTQDVSYRANYSFEPNPSSKHQTHGRRLVKSQVAQSCCSPVSHTTRKAGHIIVCDVPCVQILNPHILFCVFFSDSHHCVSSFQYGPLHRGCSR